MKAAVYNGNKIMIKNVPKPALKKSQVLIQIKAAGICGTDLAIIKGHLATPIPLILGHEFSGEIVEIGEKVNPSLIGKHVTSEINSNIDYTCFYCQQKKYTQCISRKAIGIDMDGAFAEYIAVESYLLHEFPPSLSFNEATFIEPLAAAFQTFELMPLKNEDKIMAIFGQGKLGLLILQVAKLKGLEVIVIDGSEKKLTLSKRYGANHIINRLEADSIPDEIQNLSNGLGADIVVDCSGSPNALKDAVSSCRTLGKLHIKSTHGLATPINITDIVVREITIYTSRCGPFDKAIEALSSKKINVEDLISSQYPLEEIEAAFSSYENRDHIKTLITF